MKNIVKKMLRTIFGASSEHVQGRISFISRKFRGRYFSLNELDKKLEKYVDYDNGFYVELGANDGVKQSNSLYFELNRGWSGVLVEPSPHNYLACKQNRSSDNYIYCNACVSSDFSEKYVDIEYADLMTVSKNLDSDLINPQLHIEKGQKYMKQFQDSFEFGSIAITLTELLDRSVAPRIIDFLSLDVEGAELEVLKGVDFSRYQFKYLLIEIRNFERVEQFLKSKGYYFIEKFSAGDYLFSNEQS